MKHNLWLGVLFALCGAFLYSSQVALIKGFNSILPPLIVIIFLQNLVALIMLTPFLFVNGVKGAHKIVKTKKLNLQIIRMLTSNGVSFLLYLSVLYIPITNGLLLANTAPLLVPFVGYLFLNQKINHKLWIPILIGFTGVMVVLNPDSHIFHPASFLALGSALCLATTMLVIRKVMEDDSSETTIFYFFFLSTIVTGAAAAIFWQPMSLHSFGIAMLIASLYFPTQIFGTYALKYANAQLVGSLYYSNIIYATILTLFFWHVLPTPAMVVGMILIISGGIMCIYTEHKTHQRGLEILNVRL